MRNLSIGVALGFIAILLFLALLVQPGRGDVYRATENPREPTPGELFAAAKIDERDPVALFKRLEALFTESSSCLDDWLPSIRRVEHARLSSTLYEHGYGEPMVEQRWVKIKPRLLEELRTRRRVHPARLADAILRRIEEIGVPDQISGLLEVASWPKTEWGRWKVYATVQGILTRHPAATLVKHSSITPVLARLLRDLPPAKRGEIATALEAAYRKRSDDKGLPPKENRALTTRLWLAWGLSSTDPKAALTYFRPGLESGDPALRLFAGLGIARISGGRIPYRLTTDRRAAAAKREAWLRGLRLERANDWRFSVPLDRPCLLEQRGGRIDLAWLAADGSFARRQEDVWPGVLQVLPDGTFYSGRSRRSRAVALTSPEGEVMVRFPEGRPELQSGIPEPHGGFFALGSHDMSMMEYATTGERLWECPLDDGNASARFVAGAGPGRVLLVRYRKVEILNRRGDVLWSVADRLDDPRWACALDADTVLVACQTTVELHHRTKGRLHRIDGFHSAVGARYHPTKPWLILDGGTPSAILHDLRTKKSISKELGWTNDSPNLYSRWLPPNQKYPED